MKNLDVPGTTDAWSALTGTVFVPHSEEEYRQLVNLLDGLIDEWARVSRIRRFSDGDRRGVDSELRR